MEGLNWRFGIVETGNVLFYNQMFAWPRFSFFSRNSTLFNVHSLPRLALAAGSVLSVLQCPPPPPVLRASSLLRPSSPVVAAAAAIGAGGEPLMHFLRNICVKAAVTELGLVISLIYVDRLKKVLTNMARGDPDTPFKIILSALLVVKKVNSN